MQYRSFSQTSWSQLGNLIFTWLPERLQYASNHYAGHGIAGALMGLGVGFWRKLRTYGWVVFSVLFAWAVLDHMLSNMGSMIWGKPWAQFVWSITGHGGFMPWMVAILVALVLLHDFGKNMSVWKRAISQSVDDFTMFLQTLFHRSCWTGLLIHTCQKWAIRSLSGRVILLCQIYLWLSLILVFFCNGILPRSFYYWYFKTPLWFFAGLIGCALSLWSLWVLCGEWRERTAFHKINTQLVLWGRAFLCFGSTLFLMGSLIVFFRLRHAYIFSLSNLFGTYFLYAAFNTLLGFMRDGFGSVIAIFAGLGGIISTTYAESKVTFGSNAPPDPQNWHYVEATREGLIGNKTATGHVIQSDDIFVALPSRSALNKTVQLFYNGRILEAPVLDVGPWNTNDPYWITGSRPKSEIGISISGRGTNKSGIDLSDEVFKRLGLKNNDKIYWRFK